MTYIPGTGTFSNDTKEAVKEEEKDSTTGELREFTAMNVSDLERGIEPEPETEIESEWYLQLKNWVLLGLIFSAFFAILAIFNWRFLFLLPIGPYVGYLSWHVRKILKRLGKKMDVFES